VLLAGKMQVHQQLMMVQVQQQLPSSAGTASVAWQL
jgi:hypothetical protein